MSGPKPLNVSCAASMATTSNENKLSHRWRRRALLRILMLKSSENYSSERPAVGWSVWLDDWRDKHSRVGSRLRDPAQQPESECHKRKNDRTCNALGNA